jgi:AMIN domain
MNSLPSFGVRLRAFCLAMPLLWLLPSAAQSGQPSASRPAPGAKSPTVVQALGVVVGKDGPSLEIITTGSLVPAIQKLENPLRLVIDLPNATVVMKKKYVDFHSLEIAAIRISQFENSPPIARIVVDLLRPMDYTWDGSGNRLMVRLHAAEEPQIQKTEVISLSHEGPPSVVPVSTGGAAGVVLAGNRLTAGSSVTAGADAAVLNLGRGGQVRVCPGTTVSVTTSPSGRDLMLGMSTGSLEAHYNLQSSADSILTPDFRILLAGPGEFDYAISADSRGNTCVRALPGNTASAIVSELIGDGTYQVKPAEQVVFRSGRLTTVESALPGTCGCPPPNPSVLLASEPQPPSVADKPPESVPLSLTPGPAKLASPNPAEGAEASQPNPQGNVTAAGPETAPLPALTPNDVRVQVEVPFVFRASDAPPARAPLAAPISEAAILPVRSAVRPALPATIVLAPSEADPTRKPHHGFFGKVKGFFSAVFG